METVLVRFYGKDVYGVKPRVTVATTLFGTFIYRFWPVRTVKSVKGVKGVKDVKTRLSVTRLSLSVTRLSVPGSVSKAQSQCPVYITRVHTPCTYPVYIPTVYTDMHEHGDRCHPMSAVRQRQHAHFRP